MSLKCPTCGATNADSAVWCNQCYSPFSQPAPVSDSSPIVDAGTADGVATIETVGRAIATRQMPDPTGAGWTCKSCDSPNPLDTNDCTVCGASIYETFGAEQKDRPDVAPRTVLLWALFLPGMGHVKTGNGLLGLTMAALVVFSGIAAAALASTSQGAAAAFFGVAHLVLWAISVIDAMALANGNRPMLYGRRITFVAGGLVLVIIIQVISQLGGSA